MDIDEKLYYLCRLEISKVDATDAGTYKAVATNNYGEGFATINLTFEEGDFSKSKAKICSCIEKFQILPKYQSHEKISKYVTWTYSAY